VGDTSDARYIESIRRQVDERGLTALVRWEPAVAEDRLFELFQRHDVYVFPSLFEPFALTLILALEAGIPAVVTATGGNVDLVVDHATGLLFPPGDAAALADRVAELAANPLLRRELSQAGRAAAARLTADAMITRLEAFLESAARRSAAGVGT
jgi:glycosyltransferase involved in cell wall biosynthesis